MNAAGVKKCSLLLSIISLVVYLSGFVSCTEFYAAYSDNGVPISQDTLRDTVKVPDDSLIVPEVYSLTDTMFRGEWSIRSGNFLSAMVEVNSLSNCPLLELAGVLRPSENWVASARRVSDNQSIGVGQVSTEDELNSLLLSADVQAAEKYVFNIRNTDTLTRDLNALLLLGCDTQDTVETNLGSLTDLYESYVFFNQRTIEIEDSSFYWDEVPAVSLDSIVGTIELDGAMDAWILDSTAMNEFLNFAQPPENYLYRHSVDGDTLGIQILASQTYSILLSNSTGDTANAIVDLRRKRDLEP